MFYNRSLLRYIYPALMAAFFCSSAHAVLITPLGAAYSQPVPPEVLVPAADTPPLERATYFTNDQTGEIKAYAKQPSANYDLDGGVYAGATTSAYRQFTLESTIGSGEQNGDRIVFGVKTHFGGGFLDIQGNGGATAAVIAHTNVSDPANATSSRTFSLETSIASPQTKNFAAKDFVSAVGRHIGDTVTVNTFLHTSVATNNHLECAPSTKCASTAEAFFLNTGQLYIAGLEAAAAPLPQVQAPPANAGTVKINGIEPGGIPPVFGLEDDILLEGVGSPLTFTRDSVTLFGETFASPFADRVSAILYMRVFDENGEKELLEELVVEGVLAVGETLFSLNVDQASKLTSLRKGEFYGVGLHTIELGWAINENGIDPLYTIGSAEFLVTSVPEPHSLLLLMAGMIGVRRRHLLRKKY